MDTNTSALQDEITYLKEALARAEQKLANAQSSGVAEGSTIQDADLPMPLEDYKRYGRQMILEDFGLPAQLKLRSARVLVVGAGGLGCPALQYLAASGVGTLGVVDADTVDLSNLHRQILHTTTRIGWPKALSAKAALEALNPSIDIVPHVTALDSTNALALVGAYDLVLDCTDNPATRYLISDACVAEGKVLVSGAAIGYDGQLCVYNLPPPPSSPSTSQSSQEGSSKSEADVGRKEGEREGERGPCYRCLWPTPPLPAQTGTCEELGVLGTVTGVIGTLQAQTAIQLLTGLGPYSPSAGDGAGAGAGARPTMLTFSALGEPMFRTLKLRGRRRDCLACSRAGGARELVERGEYVAFCGGEREDLEVSGRRRKEGRVGVRELEQKRTEGEVEVLDVRSEQEFSICHLPGARNVPLKTLLRDPFSHLPQDKETYVVCKLGNDSQVAAHALRSALGEKAEQVKDVVGGLRAWSKEVDPTFPMY